MTNTLKSYILATHRYAELTLDYKQGEHFVVFGADFIRSLMGDCLNFYLFMCVYPKR